MSVPPPDRRAELRRLVAQLARADRIALAVVASLVTLAVLASATGQFVSVDGATSLQVGAPTACALAVGSMLAGATFATYLRPPVGAEATVCDLRGPLIGSLGLGLGTSAGEASLVTGLAQPLLAAAGLAVVAVGLYDRLRRESAAVRQAECREAAVPAEQVDAGEVCLDCRPLFPTLFATPKERP